MILQVNFSHLLFFLVKLFVPIFRSLSNTPTGYMPEKNTKLERTNGTHSPMLSPKVSPASKTFRVPSRSIKFPRYLARQLFLSYPVYNY